ncbi:swi5-dependent recombination DNA repair protein 1 homolog [Tachyglossus aculeatus]|uniref:swi5-dependent recombination DNA repair protein 1 homolog n=1 Tax=Tachyglossus aculeatus TaxID=9261 RepID=UPI0018F4716E|nr:swi5-dependent recombination DNA repair protein 1 homolog [Tachyglossus aculeatus]XP_038614211.1 swi5-dependent recombination DNA repair protein 1 homolog [Tachyglossus aculeatus]XP_038614212.1 swi5-dependent recombination DNA repair protein 1 homolog [Tachyglossus aculeatus]
MDSPSDKAVSLPCTPKGYGSTGPLQSSGKKVMSEALKERLRKTRYSFNSYYTVAKRLKVDTEENVCTPEEASSSMEGTCARFPEARENLKKNFEECTHLKKRLEDGDFDIPKSTGNSSVPQNSPQTISASGNLTKQDLLEAKVELEKQVQEKEELLRRLKLVKMYRSKNNLSQLKSLITKWRSSSQLLLYELQSALSMDGRKLSLAQLIDNCGLEDKLLHYNRTEEEFTES